MRPLALAGRDARTPGTGACIVAGRSVTGAGLTAVTPWETGVGLTGGRPAAKRRTARRAIPHREPRGPALCGSLLCPHSHESSDRGRANSRATCSRSGAACPGDGRSPCSTVRWRRGERSWPAEHRCKVTYSFARSSPASRVHGPTGRSRMVTFLALLQTRGWSFGNDPATDRTRNIRHFIIGHKYLGSRSFQVQILTDTVREGDM